MHYFLDSMKCDCFEDYILQNLRVFFLFFFFNFVMELKWQLSIRWFRQIWWHTKYESRKNQNPLLYSWLPTGTYHKNLNLDLFIFEIWQVWVFFPWKILCIGQNCISQVKNLWHFAPQKKTLQQMQWCILATYWWTTLFGMPLEYYLKSIYLCGTTQSSCLCMSNAI